MKMNVKKTILYTTILLFIIMFNFASKAQENNDKFETRLFITSSLQSWYELPDVNNKIGFGISGTIFGGIKTEDLYLGIGPHFATNSHVNNLNYYRTVNDFGLNLNLEMYDFFIIFGAGYSNVSITNTDNIYNLSETINFPSSIGHTRFMIGYKIYSILFGSISIVNYSDNSIQNNLNRTELNIGLVF